MKILVTGAKGQLGRSLQKIRGGYPQHDFMFTDLPEADIADADGMARLIGRFEPDVIVNCAAYTAVDKAESDPAAAERINVCGVGVLAAAARDRGAKLVHVSTDYVFGGPADRPLTEDDPPAPQSVYGATKLAGERAVEASGCAAAVIRTSWLYSEFGHNFVKTMLRLAAERDILRVVDDQTGSPTYAENLARAIMRVIAHGIDGFGIYHYADEGAVTWYEFARTIFEMSGLSVAVEPIATCDYPMPARRPAYSVLSTGKIRAIGVVTPPWRESLRTCLANLKRG